MTDWHGRERVDLGTELLDRQILGPDGIAIAKVDDIELRAREDGRLEVTALIVGAAALHRRLPRWGRWLLRVGTAAAGGPSEERRVPLGAITDADSDVVVTKAGAESAASPAEDRLRRRIIGRIPGARHESG